MQWCLRLLPRRLRQWRQGLQPHPRLPTRVLPKQRRKPIPFVRIGDGVKEGQVLCIIEAMKLMNEIEAEVSGEIAKQFVPNGSPVEYGNPLFGIRRK